MGLLLPDNVTEATGDYVSPEQAAMDTEPAKEFRRFLKELDPRLDLFFVPPLDPRKPSPWPKGGRWYMVRRNDLTTDSFWVIEDEHGNYSAPTPHHLDRFKEKDTHAHPGLWKDIEKRYHQRVRDMERRQEGKREEFREKLLERLDFNYETQIAVSPAMKERLARSEGADLD